MSSSKYIKDHSKDYSLYVCENRAIPKVADGLKDSQRKMLWIIRNKADKIKTVSLAGEAISSNLYVHGDQSASSAISMMAGPYCNNIPYLKGVGNFGTRVATTEFSAPRYTYVKKVKETDLLIYPDLDIVPLKENYDGSAMEPINFLPIIPTVLLNGISGIAVGWSTDILPREVSDIVEATISVLDGKKPKHLAPKYTYLNCKVSDLGDNQWQFTGRCEIKDTSTIIVTELPPDLSLGKFKDRLNTLEDEGKILSYTDRSTEEIHVVVKLPRGLAKNWAEDEAIEYLKLSQKKKERIIVIGWNGKSIIQYENTTDLIEDFVKWRIDWYYTRYRHKIKIDSYDLNFWMAVKACFDGKLPASLSKKNNRKEIEEEVKRLCNKIELDESQISRIVSLPSYRWAMDEYKKVTDRISELKGKITRYNELLGDEKLIRNVYRDELKTLKKELA